jgi:hypothetical protein
MAQLEARMRELEQEHSEATRKHAEEKSRGFISVSLWFLIGELCRADSTVFLQNWLR